MQIHDVETSGANAMYDFYPEWGPARNREDEFEPPTSDRYWSSMAAIAAPEPRDGEFGRPDDN